VAKGARFACRSFSKGRGMLKSPLESSSLQKAGGDTHTNANRSTIQSPLSGGFYTVVRGVRGVFLLATLLSFITTTAQTQNTDSLQNLLTTNLSDTTKIWILNTLSRDLNYKDPEKALNYAHQALNIIDSLAKGEGLAGKASLPLGPSPTEGLRPAGGGSRGGATHTNIGIIHRNQGSYDKALEHFQKAAKIYEEMAGSPEEKLAASGKRGLGSTFSEIGKTYREQGNYEKALEYFINSTKLAEESGDKMGLGLVLGEIGVTYKEQGNYGKALEYHLRAANVKEEIGFKRGLGWTFDQIGVNYREQGNYKKALEYYLKASDVKEEIGFKRGLGWTFGEIGNIYKEQRNYEKALEYHLKAARVKEEIGFKRGLVYTLDVIGKIYRDLGNNNKALEHYTKALKINEEIGNKNGMTFSCNNIGNLYANQGRYDKALQYQNRGLQIAQETASKKLIRNAYRDISRTWAKMGEHPPAPLNRGEYYKNALKYYRLSAAYKDSIFNEKSSGQIAEMEAKYQNDKKQREIELLNKENEINALELSKKEAEVNKQRIIIFSSVGAFIFALALAFLLYNRYRIKQRANRELGAKNKALDEAYTQLKELEQFKESMTGMIVHDLKNPLNSIISFSGKETTDKSELEQINQAGKQMLNMTMNILDVQKFEDAEVKLELASHAVNSVMEDAISQVSVLVKQKGLKIETDVNAALQGEMDAEIISRVLVNLLTNAVKYTPAGGEIIIEAAPLQLPPVGGETLRQGVQEPPVEGFLQISVSDTGKGIPADKLNAIFEKFTQVEAKKSGQARSTGIGLTFCKMVVEAHGGEIWAESEEGKGTTFYFTLPRGKDVETGEETGNIATLHAPSLHADSADEESVVNTTDSAAEIILTEEEKVILQPLIEKFKQIDIYDTGKNTELLGGKILIDHENLKKWKEEMETAVFNFDEEQYKRLLNI